MEIVLAAVVAAIVSGAVVLLAQRTAPRARMAGPVTASPPPHDNFGGNVPAVYRGAYEFSVPGAARDCVMQSDPEGAGQAAH